MFAVFPTLLTLGNAACGFGAITFAAKVGPDPAGEHDLFLAAVFIFLAMLFDMLDGSVARWAKQTSEFGPARQPVRRDQLRRGSCLFDAEN